MLYSIVIILLIFCRISNHYSNENHRNSDFKVITQTTKTKYYYVYAFNKFPMALRNCFELWILQDFEVNWNLISENKVVIFQ